jgi:hypothetical protein
LKKNWLFLILVLFDQIWCGLIRRMVPLSVPVVALNSLAMIGSMTALFVFEAETKEPRSTALKIMVVDGFVGLVAISMCVLGAEVLLNVAITYIKMRAADQIHERGNLHSLMTKAVGGGCLVRTVNTLVVPMGAARSVQATDAATEPAGVQAPSMCPSTSGDTVPVSDESGTPTFVQDEKPVSNENGTPSFAQDGKSEVAPAAGDDALSSATTM